MAQFNNILIKKGAAPHLEILQVLVKSLSSFWDKKRLDLANDGMDSIVAIRSGWRVPSISSYDGRTFQISFIYQNETEGELISRTVWFHSEISDYKDLMRGEKSIIGIGDWGDAQMIQEFILNALKEFGFKKGEMAFQRGSDD